MGSQISLLVIYSPFTQRDFFLFPSQFFWFFSLHTHVKFDGREAATWLRLLLFLFIFLKKWTSCRPIWPRGWRERGTMFLHLLKNSQRVQNISDELFTHVCGLATVMESGQVFHPCETLDGGCCCQRQSPEIRECFDQPRLPMINLYHFRWWPDL